MLLRDAANAIYRSNDAVIRVSRPTQHAATVYALADWLGANQVRVPRPYAGVRSSGRG